jgi:hypothetical protein
MLIRPTAPKQTQYTENQTFCMVIPLPDIYMWQINLGRPRTFLINSSSSLVRKEWENNEQGNLIEIIFHHKIIKTFYIKILY